MPSNRTVQYTKLYRPGQLAIILVAFLCIAIVYFYYLMMYGQSNVYLFFAIITIPFVIGIIDSILRKRLLPFDSIHDDLTVRLKKLKIHWLLRKSGKGVRDWQRIELDLPRTIADESLESQLTSIIIPDGLIEPERVFTSRPGSLFGCVAGVAIYGFILWGVLLVRLPQMYKWALAVVLCWSIFQLILGLPSVHRSRKLPGLLRRIGRRRTLGSPIVVGPGWVKLEFNVFRADRDLLLIRRVGFRLASSEVDCMLVGPIARQRMIFSGVGDEDFQVLFGAWNLEDVRTEFIHSDLS